MQIMTSTTLRLIAASELFGGLALIVGYVVGAAVGDWTRPIWAVPGLAFAVLAIVAGTMIFRGHPWAVRTSLAVQVLQIFGVSSLFSFRYVALAGPAIQAIIASTGVRMALGAGGTFIAVPWSRNGLLDAPGMSLDAGIGIFPQPLADSQFTFGINVLAIYFAWCLLTIGHTVADTDRGVNARDASR